MKLQELLTKHENNLGGIGRAVLMWNEDKNKYVILLLDIYENISISDLLFNTPFLSLLDWNDQYYNGWYSSNNEEYGSSDYQYHKINLVLLPDDKSRIEYIEQFTL